MSRSAAWSACGWPRTPPDRIAALAVCCTSACFPDRAFWTDRAAKVRAGGLAPLAGQVVGRWFTPAFARGHDPATPAAFVATLSSSVDPVGYAGCCDAIAGMDLRPALPAITAPTLVIAGSEDPATPPWHGAVIARAIPGARLRVIRGAAHLANVSQPGEVTVALTSHLLAAQAGLAGGWQATCSALSRRAGGLGGAVSGGRAGAACAAAAGRRRPPGPARRWRR